VEEGAKLDAFGGLAVLVGDDDDEAFRRQESHFGMWDFERLAAAHCYPEGLEWFALKEATKSFGCHNAYYIAVVASIPRLRQNSNLYHFRSSNRYPTASLT